MTEGLQFSFGNKDKTKERAQGIKIHLGGKTNKKQVKVNQGNQKGWKKHNGGKCKTKLVK